jgi:hypothetical protein
MLGPKIKKAARGWRKLHNEELHDLCPTRYLSGIALGYGLDDRGFGTRGEFSLHHRVQNGSGTHPASCPMGTRGSFPGDKTSWA